MNPLYPLKFEPIFKYKIWGGHKLNSELNKECAKTSIGESWEISGVENEETIVKCGMLKGLTLKELIVNYKADFLGEDVYNVFGENFPLLIKFIDSEKPLSIQVHPNDTIAKQKHGTFGKSEMWYIIKSENDGNVIDGFKGVVNMETYLKHLKTNTLLDILHKKKVTKGDVFYIPSGRIHAIGSGVLLAEIQQTSDITYRVYDYNRIDSETSELRELHTSLAEDAIDFNQNDYNKIDYRKEKNKSNKLIHSPYFKTNFLPVNGIIKLNHSNINSFVIYICVAGDAIFNYEKKKYVLEYGGTILIPAIINSLVVEGNNAELLQVSLS